EAPDRGRAFFARSPAVINYGVLWAGLRPVLRRLNNTRVHRVLFRLYESHVRQRRDGFDLTNGDLDADAVKVRRIADDLGPVSLELVEQCVADIGLEVQGHSPLSIIRKVRFDPRYAVRDRLAAPHLDFIDELRIYFPLRTCARSLLPEEGLDLRHRLGTYFILPHGGACPRNPV